MTREGVQVEQFPSDRHSGSGRRHHAGDRVDRGLYVVIDDYYDRGWRRPPEGHRHVRIDDRYYLLAIGTGLIVEALSN